ncbi:MAG: BrnT family toxin [Chitinispirillales bacterium]|jgi:uncharacterized DUF497 family protein|nr:BrnT family toxin [Chitinispirillales bacterium]
MSDFDFIWDINKNLKNIASHGIAFDEAKTVFYDPNAMIIYDPDHSEDEDRFIILGLSKRLNLLVVCHCYREGNSIVRIISARKATLSERKQYGGKR